MKRSGLVLPTLAVCAFSYMLWHLSHTAKSSPPVSPVVAPARVPFRETLAGAGLIEPFSETISIGTPVPGVVAEVAVKVGQVVSQGDLLFRIDDRQRRAELMVQEAALVQKKSELARLRMMPREEDLPPAEARLQQSLSVLQWEKDQLNRVEGLTSQQVTSQQQLVERKQAWAAARAAADVTQAELDRLKAGPWLADIQVTEAAIATAQATLQMAKTELERLEVRAPINGTILKVDVRPGEYIGAPATQTLIALGDISVLHVRVDIDEHDLPRFRPGLPGEAYVRGDATRPIPLRFVRIDPFTEPKKSLTGKGDERIDTRVLKGIYAIQPTSDSQHLFVGQQVDVFLKCPESSANSQSETQTSARNLADFIPDSQSGIP